MAALPCRRQATATPAASPLQRGCRQGCREAGCRQARRYRCGARSPGRQAALGHGRRCPPGTTGSLGRGPPAAAPAGGGQAGVGKATAVGRQGTQLASQCMATSGGQLFQRSAPAAGTTTARLQRLGIGQKPALQRRHRGRILSPQLARAPLQLPLALLLHQLQILQRASQLGLRMVKVCRRRGWQQRGGAVWRRRLTARSRLTVACASPSA